MRVIEKQIISPHSKEKLFSLVESVEHYAHFVPYCKKSFSEVLSENKLRGELVFSALGVENSFSTINTLFPYDKIVMDLDSGPFKSLQGIWSFSSLENSHCSVSLSLSFEFANKSMDMLFGFFFERFAAGLVSAFVKRAQEFSVNT